MSLPAFLARPDLGPDPVLGDRTEHQTPLEERLNSGIHLGGLVLSLVGLGVLMSQATMAASTLKLVAMAIYGSSMVLMFLASSLYHSARDSKAKLRFQVLDYAAVFLLIAGTYTPFTLITLQGTLGMALFGLVWFVALTGAGLQVFTAGRYRVWNVIHTVATGWVIVLAGPRLFDSLSLPAFAWLLAGGLAYTIGTGFYLARKVRFSHAIWHILVLVGAACHWYAVLRYVL